MEHLSLAEIGIRNGCDKETHHHYFRLFEKLFEPIRYLDKPNILEIGLQFGNSFRTWLEYFPNAVVTGIDSVDNGVSSDSIRGRLFFGDAYSQEMLNRIPKEFDIIIDDGSHRPEDQKWFVQHYNELLSDEGYLIVEDVLERETIPILAAALPDNFYSIAVEVPEGNSLVDSRLFVAWRKQ